MKRNALEIFDVNALGGSVGSGSSVSFEASTEEYFSDAFWDVTAVVYEFTVVASRVFATTEVPAVLDLVAAGRAIDVRVPVDSSENKEPVLAVTSPPALCMVICTSGFAQAPRGTDRPVNREVLLVVPIFEGVLDVSNDRRCLRTSLRLRSDVTSRG